MSTERIILERLIKDPILANGLEPHTIEIVKQLKPIVKTFSSAFTSYKACLGEEKRKVVLTVGEKQAKHIKWH